MLRLSWWEFCRRGESQTRCQFKAMVIDCNWWIVLKLLSLHCSCSKMNKWQTVELSGPLSFHCNISNISNISHIRKMNKWQTVNNFGTFELPLQHPTLHLPCLGRESSRTPGIWFLVFEDEYLVKALLEFVSGIWYLGVYLFISSPWMVRYVHYLLLVMSPQYISNIICVLVTGHLKTLGVLCLWVTTNHLY